MDGAEQSHNAGSSVPILLGKGRPESLAAEWSFEERLRIKEPERLPALLFELGSNDHEFRFVIMGEFYEAGLNV
jgi:hypothetical protein